MISLKFLLEHIENMINVGSGLGYDAAYTALKVIVLDMDTEGDPGFGRSRIVASDQSVENSSLSKPCRMCRLFTASITPSSFLCSSVFC